MDPASTLSPSAPAPPADALIAPTLRSELASLFAPLNLRRAIVLAAFALLLWVFRSLLLLFVFFVAFERTLGTATRWLASWARIPRGRALVAVLGLSTATLGTALLSGAGQMVEAFFAVKEGLPEHIAAFQGTDVFALVSRYVDAEALLHAAKDNAAHALTTLATLGHTVLEAAIALVLAIVYVVDEDEILAFRRAVAPRTLGGTLLRFFGHAADAISVTLQFQVVVAACNAVLTLPVLFLVGIPHASAFAFVVFVSGVIPVVGNFISGAILTLLAYQAQGWSGVAIFTVLTFLLHKIESYYLNPRLAARHVRLPGFVLVVSLVLWEALIGFRGLFVSFPFLYLATAIRRDFEEEDAAAPA